MKHDPYTDSALELSLSEISALSMRAIRGAGRSWGEAEEGAHAACWLARAGLDWAGALLKVLDPAACSDECPMRTGILLADNAGLPEQMPRSRKLRYKLSCAGFLLPFAACLADRTGEGITLEWRGARAVLAPGAAPRLEGPASLATRAEVTISVIAPESARSPAWPRPHRGAVAAAQYARLTRLMMAVTVPSSASSLAGAGAGARGDDND